MLASWSRSAKRSASDAGMVIGAVAEILEDVAALRERRLADPLRALAAHLGEALGLRSIHSAMKWQPMPAAGARAFRHLGRGIVRTAGAEIGRAAADIRRVGEHRLELFQPATRRGDLLGAADDREHPFAERDRDVVGIERALGRETARRRARPSCRRRPAGSRAVEVPRAPASRSASASPRRR
jgi:hypothetical protein